MFGVTIRHFFNFVSISFSEAITDDTIKYAFGYSLAISSRDSHLLTSWRSPDKNSAVLMAELPMSTPMVFWLLKSCVLYGKMGSKTTVLGIMSGSSLDGLDLCTTRFEKRTNTWTYQIMDCQTIEIPKPLLTQLEESRSMDSIEMLELDVKYGEWIGQTIKKINHPYSLKWYFFKI